MEATIERFHAILNDKELFKKESSVIYKDIKTWLNNSGIPFYNFANNQYFKDNYNYPANTPTEIISKLIENNYEFTQEEFNKFIECVIFGKTKSYISKCYDTTVGRKDKVIEHLFTKFDPTNEQVNKLLKCYNDIPLEGKGIKYFEWIRILSNRNYPFSLQQLKKIMSSGCSLMYMLIYGNYMLEAESIQGYFKNGITIDNIYNYDVFEKQNVFNNECLDNLLTSSFVRNLGTGLSSRSHSIPTMDTFLTLTNNVINLSNIMLSRGAFINVPIIDNYIKETNHIDFPFTLILNHLLSNITLNTITEDNIINWIHEMRKKQIECIAYYKISLIILCDKVKIYTCNVLNNIIRYPDTRGNNVLSEMNVSELIENIKHITYVSIEINLKNKIDAEITDYDFFRLFLHNGVEPDIRTMEAIIPNHFIVNSTPLLAIFGTTQVNREYMDELIHKYKICPTKSCLDNAMTNIFDIEMIKEILNHKIVPDLDTVKAFITGINIYKRYFQQKTNSRQENHYKVITELLIHYGLIINIEIIRDLFQHCQIDNLERFGIPYDDKIYYLCHKYNTWPTEYIDKFTIDINIIKLREMFARRDNYEKIIQFMKKYNLKPDRYCIENSCVFSPKDALFFMEVLKCKSTTIGLAFLCMMNVNSAGRSYGGPIQFCSNKYYNKRVSLFFRCTFCVNCKKLNFKEMSCGCPQKKDMFSLFGDTGSSGGPYGITGPTGKIYITDRQNNIMTPTYDNGHAYTYVTTTLFSFILYNVAMNNIGESFGLDTLFETYEEPEIMAQPYEHIDLNNL